MNLKGHGYVPGYAYGELKDLNEALTSSTGQKIILLRDPTLERIIQLSEIHPSALVIVGAQRFSHLLIYLFSLGIPTVLINEGQGSVVEKNSLAFVDGASGIVYLNPDQLHVRQLQKKIGLESTISASSGSKGKAATLDGVKITVGASVSSPKGASDAKRLGADEIGLLRSEFLFMNDITPPSIVRNHAALLEICQASNPLPLTIRLFDLGGEKLLRWVPEIPDSSITLGIRGSRFYTQTEFQKILTAQLKAISRLSKSYNISVLIPYLSSMEDFLVIKGKIQASIQSNVRVGAMLETTAMCYSIPELARIADFISIGTNDLMQSFFGADRASNVVAKYLDPYSPSLLRLFHLVGMDAAKFRMKVRICGQLPLYPYWINLLIGFGFREFSVEPYIIPTMKRLIRELEYDKVEKLAEEALEINGKAKLKRFLQKSYKTT